MIIEDGSKEICEILHIDKGYKYAFDVQLRRRTTTINHHLSKRSHLHTHCNNMLSFKLALATAFALTVVALPAAMPDVFPTILTDMLDDGSENHTSSMLARDEDQQKPVCHMQFEDGYFRWFVHATHTLLSSS